MLVMLHAALEMRWAGMIELVVDKEDLGSRREKFGSFALFTHCSMTPAEMINVYTSRDLVEKGLQELNYGFQRLSDNALPCRRWHR